MPPISWHTRAVFLAVLVLSLGWVSWCNQRDADALQQLERSEGAAGLLVRSAPITFYAP